MSLLFDAPVIPGLNYADELIGEAEERALLDRLILLDLAPFRFHGWLGNRKTHSFGWRYDFDDASFAPGDPIPEWLLAVRAKAADFAGLAPDDFVHVLLARYDPGAGIGWHRDRPVFGDVVGLSLLAPAPLRFRRKAGSKWQRFTLTAEPRSAYLLRGEARHEWEHSIPQLETLRYSVTLRTLAA